ncbi:hypothetical protein XU18_5251 [Perkinsela sp. CCAP 1560/4]|nr:hypothetical protein XU18_5251 [Perkinsela sp. CCAP 1560/4]|eukprot:KNH00530.1 hypothetical protein XU18_5251 [Perkinsela sp. CCAP 1560/4]
MNSETLLHVAHKIEEVVDSQIDTVDNLEEDELREIRRRRVDQLKSMQKRRADWARKGHGQYNEILSSQDFFNVCKDNERVVVHFYRTSTERCQILHSHLEKISGKHFETYFGKVNVEKVVGLAEHFNVILLPTVMLIEKAKTLHSLIGFDELGGTDSFSTEKLAHFLGDHGLINLDGMFAADQTATL